MNPSPARSAGTVHRYTRIAVALHWILALALLAQLVLGWWMLGVPKSPPGLRAGWFNLHKSIGLTIGVVVFLRISWRTGHHPPPDDGLPAWQRIASRVNHALLYLCMAALPFTGYFGSTFTRYPVHWFGWVLPSWNTPSESGKEAMGGLHQGLVWLLMASIALHVLATAWHRIRQDGHASRMAFHH